MKTAAIVMLILLAVLILILLLVCGFVFNQIIWRKTLHLPNFISRLIAGNSVADTYPEKARAAKKEMLNTLPIESVSITAPDGANLRGKVIVPKNSNGRLIIACHGARSTGMGEFCFSSKYFYENGYTLVMPDHRGCGESDGKFMGYGTHESKDTFLWLDYAKNRFPQLQNIYLYGVSMGAATVLMMSKSASDPAVKGIIADCAYTSAWEEYSYQLKTSFHLPDFPVLHICDLYCGIFAKYRFKDASPIDAVRESKKPVLFIHGDRDDFVPFFMMDKLYEACCAPKEKLAVEGAVHARSYYTNPAVYENAVERFMAKCEEKR